MLVSKAGQSVSPSAGAVQPAKPDGMVHVRSAGRTWSNCRVYVLPASTMATGSTKVPIAGQLYIANVFWQPARLYPIMRSSHTVAVGPAFAHEYPAAQPASASMAVSNVTSNESYASEVSVTAAVL